MLRGREILVFLLFSPFSHTVAPGNPASVRMATATAVQQGLAGAKTLKEGNLPL